MIRKLLFIATILSAGVVSAQTFEFQDINNNNIGGTNHYEWGSAAALSAVKFHVENVSGTPAEFMVKAYDMSNPTGVDLQVCFGSACYIGSAGSSPYTAPDSALVAAGATYTDLKVGPFSFGWVAGDSATWRVTVFNKLNPNDSASAVITWKVAGVSISEFSENDVTIKAYPNPATNNLNFKYNFTGNVQNSNIKVFDIVGKNVATYPIIKKSGTLNIDVKDLDKGVYFFTVYGNNQAIKTERVIVR